MNGKLILIAFVLSAALLAFLVAKLVSFCRNFAAHTLYICYEMDHADNYNEYRKWRGELRCHYLCLIPFVNRTNVIRLYNRIYHRADKVKKERGDSLAPLLLPSILGIFICTVCVCGMTWAWYTASVETPAQKLTSAYYEVSVESVLYGESIIESADGIHYSLEADTSYTVTLKASGSVKECGGYCLIQNETGEKTYTQTFKPGDSITVQFAPAAPGNYTFTGVWGSLPAGTVNYLHNAVPAVDPITDDFSTDDTNTSAQSDSTEPTDQPSEPSHGTYTVQSGDTLSGIAAKFNTTADKIAAYNGFTDKGDIKAGQILNIPPDDYVIPETTAPQEQTVSTESIFTVTDPSNLPSTEPTDEPATESTSVEEKIPTV